MLQCSRRGPTIGRAEDEEECTCSLGKTARYWSQTVRALILSVLSRVIKSCSPTLSNATVGVLEKKLHVLVVLRSVVIWRVSSHPSGVALTHICVNYGRLVASSHPAGFVLRHICVDYGRLVEDYCR